MITKSSYDRETSKKVVIWRLSGCFWDDIKVVIRRLTQMTSFGRLWGVRFWHQFDNPKVVHLTTLFFECCGIECFGRLSKEGKIICSIWKRSWWRHQMETFSAILVLCAWNSPVNSPHKGQWRGALMFSLICALNKQLSKQWRDQWLRRHRAHYDGTVMFLMEDKTHVTNATDALMISLLLMVLWLSGQGLRQTRYLISCLRIFRPQHKKINSFIN